MRQPTKAGTQAENLSSLPRWISSFLLQWIHLYYSCSNLLEQVGQAEYNLWYFELNQAFCYNECSKNKTNSFQVLRLPATTGRPKIGQANQIAEATCYSR